MRTPFTLSASQDEIDKARARLPAGVSDADLAWFILNDRMGRVTNPNEIMETQGLMADLLEAEGKTTQANSLRMMSYARSRRATFDAAGDYVTGIRFSVISDDHTTPFCKAIHGRSIAKTDPYYSVVRVPFAHTPPCVCRTIEVPIVKDKDANWKFDTDWEEWLRTHDPTARSQGHDEHDDRPPRTRRKPQTPSAVAAPVPDLTKWPPE